MRPFIGFWKGSGTVPPPILACPAPYDWPTEVSGLPYANSGGSTAGLVDLFGEGLPVVSGGELTYGFPANADPDPSSGTFRKSGFQIPVVAQDFTMEFEFRIANGTLFDYLFGALFFSNELQGFTFGGGAWTVTTGGLLANWYCDVVTQSGGGSLPFDPALPSSGLLNDTSWHTYKVQRSGTVFTITVDGFEWSTWDCESLVIGNLGIFVNGRTWDSQAPTFNVRNISITSP